MGNVHLKWAFSEAAVLFLRHAPGGTKLWVAIETKHGKGKALSILAHKIGRAVFYILSRRTVFSLEKFRAASRRRERVSHTSNSSQQDRARRDRIARVRPRSVPSRRSGASVRQPQRLMGHPLSSSPRGPRWPPLPRAWRLRTHATPLVMRRPVRGSRMSF
jgi:hypothetical protein